jgi:DNA-binding transcriptional MerR regulator
MAPSIRTNAAAELLGVSPNTLRSWERRFGYPQPERTAGNHRQYELLELQTLRDALTETGNIASAIELSRQRQTAPATQSGLQAALETFDEGVADRAMEESLALRPLERTIEELLLPTLDELAGDPEREAEMEFGSRWAMGWLHSARRLASTASRPAGILMLEGNRAHDVEAVHAQALDLALRRAGFRVLTLSSELGRERLERALQALEPTAIVLCGAAGKGEGAGKLLRRIRDLGVAAPLYGFRIPDLDSDETIVTADTPTGVTQALNADLRRRAAGAFA